MVGCSLYQVLQDLLALTEARLVHWSTTEHAAGTYIAMDLVGIAGDVLQELESSEGKFSCEA